MVRLRPLPPIDPQVIARMRAIVAERWAPETGALTTITQVRCFAPGCSPLETVVVVAPVPGVQHRVSFHASAADVTDAQLREALAAL